MAKKYNAAAMTKLRIVQKMQDEGRLLAACTERLESIMREGQEGTAVIAASEGLTESQLKVIELMGG